MNYIRIESSDKVVFFVKPDIIKCSEVIKKALDCCNNADAPMRLEYVNARTFLRVLSWAERYKEDLNPNAKKNEEANKDVNWDAQFINMEQRALFELFKAADYLDIKGLMKLSFEAVIKLIEDANDDHIIGEDDLHF